MKCVRIKVGASSGRGKQYGEKKASVWGSAEFSLTDEESARWQQIWFREQEQIEAMVSSRMASRTESGLITKLDAFVKRFLPIPH
jgi:hypothetical protein